MYICVIVVIYITVLLIIVLVVDINFVLVVTDTIQLPTPELLHNELLDSYQPMRSQEDSTENT